MSIDNKNNFDYSWSNTLLYKKEKAIKLVDELENKRIPILGIDTFIVRGGKNGQVANMRIMDPRPAKGKAPAYPNGYIVYSNSRRQAVNPYTGQTGSRLETHFELFLEK